MEKSELVTDKDISMTPICSIENLQTKRAEEYLRYVDKILKKMKEYRVNKRNANPNKNFKQIGNGKI